MVTSRKCGLGTVVIDQVRSKPLSLEAERNVLS